MLDWKGFRIDLLFDVYTGALLSKKDLKTGKDPRISASETDNGIIGTYAKINNNKHYRDLNNFISVSFLGGVFYHPYTASLDMKIHALKLKNGKEFNNYTACFLIRLLKNQFARFSYGNQLSSTDLPHQMILLPVNEKTKQPDWEYMENYMREIEKRQLTKYINYVKTIEPRRNVERESCQPDWSEFRISDLFIIGAGKRLTQADMQYGRKPFIGASDSNNGVTAFVSNTNVSQDENVLGVNYNGSVVENFYHPYQCIFSDDVKRFKLKNVEGNKYLYLFVKAEIMKQRSKYQYGYKFNEARMKQQTLLLPSTKAGQPNYEYMEQVMMELEYNQLSKYAKYIAPRL